jgi:transposase
LRLCGKHDKKGTTIVVLFLPPYSPQMNPIEKLWAAIKQQWRQRRVRGFPPLQATLQADLQQIVEKSGKAIVASCGYSSFLS